MGRKKKSRRKHKARPSQPRQQRRPKRRKGPPPPSRNERRLRDHILRFIGQDRFRKDFERAVRRYFGRDALRDNTIIADEDELPGFFEWYIHDYVTSEGERLIRIFARDVGPRLPPAQQRILDDWIRTNRLRLFEVQNVKPGIGVTVKDLLSDEVLEVNDISASYALTRWQVFVSRPLLTEGRLSFAGTGIPLPPMDKPELLKFAQKLWKKYQKRHPQASLDDFYQDRGLDIYQYALEIATTIPPLYTPEGHPLVFSKADYKISDPTAVKERLDEAEEFIPTGTDYDDETTLTYTWVLKGRSRVPEAPITGRGAIMKTDLVSESDTSPYRSLGEVLLWQDRLELHCFSRERLKAGKALLKEILGRLARHQGDEFQDVATALESLDSSPPYFPEEEVDEALSRQILAAQIEEWLDTPTPALDGLSPREAARDPAMREQLEEMLKTVEYIEEQKRREGDIYIDTADLRRELGLPPH